MVPEAELQEWEEGRGKGGRDEWRKFGLQNSQKPHVFNQNSKTKQSSALLWLK